MATDLNPFENRKRHNPENCPVCKFAHLHQHTQFSLLDGAARIKDLLSWVKKVSPDEPMLAMTDHGNLFGAVQFYKLATEMGVKPIIGYEAYVAAESRFDRKQGKGLDGGYFHLTLLAQNMEGYQNLSRLASRAYLEGFYGKPRVDREILREHNAGIIALSGCLGAEIPQFILQERYHEAETRLQEYLSIFGEERYFVEIQDHGLAEQHKLNKVLKEFADKYGLGIVATNDGHYVKKEDAEAHAVVLAVQSKATWDDPNRWKFPCDEFYVKSPEEMVQTFLDEKELWGSRMDELFDNTVNIGRMCNVELVPPKVQYRIPKYPLPQGRTEVTYFRELTFAGLLKRYPDRVTSELYREFLRKIGRPVPHGQDTGTAGDENGLLHGDGESLALELALTEDLEAARAHLPELGAGMVWDGWAILSRAVYELSVVERMGFTGYLLIVGDFINWAKDNGISVGPGRGSAAGSLVTYATRITNIDPLEYNLLFERFLNPARVSMPDIDTDFSDLRRGEVIEYVRQRYGDEMVAQIGTFGTLASKAAIKDAARVFGLPIKKADQLAKLIPVVFGKPAPLDKAIETIPDLRQEMEKDPLVRRVMEVAQKLEGLSRQSSVHAAGVVISDVPLQDYIPLMRAGEGGGKVTQYDMGSVEALGFLKMDFLGLRTLSFLDECKRIVKESRGVDIDFDAIPVDDARTFELLGRGETKGIFQLDSAGMTSAVRGLKPRRIQDIIALGALYRPGPMENIPTYIRRHHGREAVDFPQFPTAEKYIRPILEETYGIPVYQEQIMQIATVAAGYSLGEADLLRRAMGKKKMEEMALHRAQFKKGAGERGIPGDEADRLFDLLEAFANYGFNKCVTGDTLVVDASTGRRVRVADIVEGRETRVCVPSLDEQTLQIVPKRVVDAFSSGKAMVYRLITQTGRTLKATDNHPVYTPLGWKNLGEVGPNDFVAVPRRLPYRSSTDWADHYLVVMGYALSEGNLCHPSGFYVYGVGEEELQDYITHLVQFENTTYTQGRTKSAASVYTKRIQRSKESGATQFLRDQGVLGLNALNKRVPEAVFALSREQIALFLGRLWTGDGGIQPSTRLVFYATSSAYLAQDVQHLLLRLGLPSRVHRKVFKYRDAKRMGYTVHLLGGQESVLRFAATIGRHLVGKRKCDLKSLLATYQPDEDVRFSRDVLPNALLPTIQAEVRRIAIEKDQTYHQLLRSSGFSSGRDLLRCKTKGYGLSRSTLQRLSQQISSPVLSRQADAEIYWDKVASVEALGVHEVYDLTVEGTHSFVANDIVVHNSHSAAYAILTYQTAYVKAHFPVEFFAAVLTVERGDSDKVAEYIRAARSVGVEVLPPDINRSGFSFRAFEESVLFGLSAVKNVGETATEQILAEREQGGRFKSLPDFLKRADATVANKRVVESLIKAGAFDAFGPRGPMLAALDDLLRWAQAEREQAQSGMMGLFADAQEPQIPKVGLLDALSELRMEKEALGIYVTGHPLSRYTGLREAASCTVEELPQAFAELKGSRNRARLLLAGMVEGIARKPTRSGGMLVRFTLGDETGAVEVVGFGKSYDKISPRIAEDTAVLVAVEVEPDGEGESLRVVAQDVFPYNELEGLPKVLELELDLALVDDDKLLDLRSRLDEFPGGLPVQLKVRGPGGVALVEAREVKAAEEAIPRLQGLDWLDARLIPDRETLLGYSKAGEGNGRNHKGPDQGPVVPF
jgi:DNA polymerase-3 subunit alpha